MAFMTPNDGQPVLAITDHTFHDLIGTHYQQDVDLDKLYMDVAPTISASPDPIMSSTSWTKRSRPRSVIAPSRTSPSPKMFRTEFGK
jgi:hypothetical protein